MECLNPPSLKIYRVSTPYFDALISMILILEFIKEIYQGGKLYIYTVGLSVHMKKSVWPN